MGRSKATELAEESAERRYEVRFVKPEVYLIAETKLIPEGLGAYITDIGVNLWTTDAPSHAETLTEFMGRLCYNSFKPGLNPNVTKVREGNRAYLQNIIAQEHGSVMEHATVTFVFHNVSRVFTHELVRHRVGVAISQESLRYVRLSDLKVWIPNLVLSNIVVENWMRSAWNGAEWAYLQAAALLDLDNEKSFDLKKKWTSALRRMAPIGLATTIGWTVNLRTLRHVIEKRTNRHAEEEIRLVFAKVAEIVRERYPNIFADYELEKVDGIMEYTTKHPKI